MTYNNAPVVLDLGNHLESDTPSGSTLKAPIPRRRATSQPCLPERLPSIGFIQREADGIAPKAVADHLRRHRPSLSVDTETHDRERAETSTQTPSRDDLSPMSASQSSLQKAIKQTILKKEPEPYEIFSAIEKKDIMFLMAVRDSSFPLLLRSCGNATPLLHAMRIGQSHRDVAILLLGAFSRWINHIPDEDIDKAETKDTLRSIRSSLKLAINFGLAQSQNDLTASLLQTLVMSEGDRWISNQVSTLAWALRAGAQGEPVKSAGDAVRRFATLELGNADFIAALEDYIANATADLIMMAAWKLALEVINGEGIPPYYFARDDRVYKAFVHKLDIHKEALNSRASRRLKWQLRTLRTTLEGRLTTYRSKIEALAKQLDVEDK
ncbi:hypothetical protein BD779DRAFT_1490939 [Infundibulicybe gibba]|nr:hypothetical protein BD779DRAFT_1490939 [Infundibulicybe gibba]